MVILCISLYEIDYLFQSTDKKMIYGRIYGFFLTWFSYYPPLTPLHFRGSRYFARTE